MRNRVFAWFARHRTQLKHLFADRERNKQGKGSKGILPAVMTFAWGKGGVPPPLSAIHT